MAQGDLTTLAAVKLQLETTVTDDDALLSDLITRASAAIKVHVGREFVGPAAAETRVIAVGERWDPEYGLRVGDLRATPTAIDVLDADGALLGALTPGTHVTYLPLGRSASAPITRLRLRSTATVAPVADGAVRITALWGWPAVPVDVEQACIWTVRDWQAKSSVEWGGMPDEVGVRGVDVLPRRFVLPYAALQVLRQYRRIGVA